MQTVETLEIEVKKSASDASSGIEGLIGTLNRLKQAASGGAGLASAVRQIRRIGEAITGVSDAGSGLDGTIRRLESIASIDFSNLRGAARDIDSIAKYVGCTRNEIMAMSLEFALEHMEIVMREREEKNNGSDQV